MKTIYPRDLIGYGPNPPKADWPGGARIAVQFVLNYEEGGENSSCTATQPRRRSCRKSYPAQPLMGVRHISIEQLYEYGSRVGVWRILRLFERKNIPLTVYAVAMAAERHPEVIKAMVDAGHEIASHGYRWINYQYVAEDVEREHIQKAVEIPRKWLALLHWDVHRPHQSEYPAARRGAWRLPLRRGRAKNDDLPYWTVVEGKPQLIVPYTLDANDMGHGGARLRLRRPILYVSKEDPFDVLYAKARRPRA